MQTLTIGSLAYFDSFAGLIPCKVLAITGQSGMCGSMQDVTLQLTAARGAYKRGEVLTTWGLHAVPRKSVYGRMRRIRAYQVQAVAEPCRRCGRDKHSPDCGCMPHER